jgi:replicative DNA helicase
MKKLNPELLDRLPPQDLNAERWVIGSALLQPSSLDDLAEVVCRDDFHADAHRKLFGLLVSMHDRSEPIDIGLIVNRLRESGELEAVGGVSYIAEVMQGIPHAAHACHYAAIVAKKARYRRLIHAAAATLRDAYDAAAEPEEILNSLERDLVEIETAEHDGEPVPMSEAVAEAITKIDAVMARQRTAGLMTGLTLFDEQIGGLFRGELFILAARPSVGKTSLACQIATHFAARKRPVLFVSAGMSAAELATRILCSMAACRAEDSHRRLQRKDQAQLASPAGTVATNWLRFYGPRQARRSTRPSAGAASETPRPRSGRGRLPSAPSTSDRKAIATSRWAK